MLRLPNLRQFFGCLLTLAITYIVLFAVFYEASTTLLRQRRDDCQRVIAVATFTIASQYWPSGSPSRFAGTGSTSTKSIEECGLTNGAHHPRARPALRIGPNYQEAERAPAPLS